MISMCDRARIDLAVRLLAVGVCAPASRVLLLVPSAHAQQTARAKALGQKLMCVCGCNQILTACNHVGCTVFAQDAAGTRSAWSRAMIPTT